MQLTKPLVTHPAFAGSAPNDFAAETDVSHIERGFVLSVSRALRNGTLAFLFVVLVGLPSEPLALGLKAGVNSSHVGFGSGAYEQSESVTGFIGGAYHDFTVSETVTFRPSLLVARRGGVYRDLVSMLWGGEATVDELRFRRDYLELPLVLRYSPLGSRRISPFVAAGLMWSIVLTSEVSEDGAVYPNHAGKSDSAYVVSIGSAVNGFGREIEMEFMYRFAEDGPSTDEVTGFFRSEGFAVMVGVEF